jgi:pimeloyl-ACP methyl ester carboxylesterase
VSTVRRRDDWEGAVAAARGLRRQELLRVACADLLGLRELDQVGSALSDVSAAVVAAALATAERKVAAERRGELPVHLAVIAMGRLGGGEQGYGSDADVLFVHRPVDGASDGEASNAALAIANELRRLLALPAPDPPLLVDADLRPEGKQGPLSRSLSSYAGYYQRWSLVWEAQALLRAAPLAGDAALTADFLALVDPVRWPRGGSTTTRCARSAASRRGRERAAPRGGRPQARAEARPGRHRRRRVGPCSCCNCGTPGSLPWTAHQGSRPSGAAAAVDAGLVAEDDAAVLRTAWERCRPACSNALVLVRGRGRGAADRGADIAAAPSPSATLPVQESSWTTTDRDPVVPGRRREGVLRVSSVRTVPAAATSFLLREHGAPDAPGTPVLLLHGVPETSSSWRDVAPALAQGRRVLAPDLPGLGGSAFSGPYDVPCLVEQLAALVEQEVPGGRVDVVGHDWGGSLALALAGARPDLVRRLVVANAPYREVPLLRAVHIPFFALPALPELALRASGRRFVDAAFGLLWKADTALHAESLAEYRAAYSQRTGRKAMLGYYRAAARPRLAALVRRDQPAGSPRISAEKMMVLWGSLDPVLPVSTGERVVRDLGSDCVMVTVPGAGHFVVEEAPDVVRQVLLDFLSDPATPAPDVPAAPPEKP